MKDTPRKLIENAIRTDVFVSSEQAHIVSNEDELDLWIFDFRKIILRPEILDAYTELFFTKYKSYYPFQVCGLETAAIPLITAIVTKSHQLNLPVNGFFIRKSRKKTGLLNMIEGVVDQNKIILVDDIINSGSSFKRQVEVLEGLEKINSTRHKIIEIFAILSFHTLSEYKYFIEKNIAIESIFSLKDFSDEIRKIPLPNPKPISKNHFVTNWQWQGNKPSYEIVQPKAGTILKNGYLYTITDDGRVVCLDTETGLEKWVYTISFNLSKRKQFSKPLICSDLLIFGSHDGNIYALDTDTGGRRWVNFEADWIKGSICSNNKDTVYAPLQYGLLRKRSAICAISATSGNVLWSTFSLKGNFHSTAFSAKNNLVIAGTDTGELYAFDAKTGKIIWQTNICLSKIMTPLILDSDKLVIITGITNPNEEMSGVYAYSLKDGSLRWSTPTIMYGSYSTPISFKDTLIVGGLDKKIHCFSVKTGKPLWTTEINARIFSTAVYGSIRNNIDSIYVGANDSILYELNPSTGQITGESLFTERITNEAIVDKTTNQIYVTTYANEIFAIKPKNNPPF